MGDLNFKIGDLKISGASTPGRSHLLGRQNKQDAIHGVEFFYNDVKYVCMVVADGCGSSEFSEFCAITNVQFLTGAAKYTVSQGIKFTEQFFEEIIFDNLLEHYKYLAKGYFFSNQDRKNWIENNLYATALGIITDGRSAKIFYVGDGYIIVKDKITELENVNGKPSYPAYAIMDGMLNDHDIIIPKGFNTVLVEGKDLEQVIISTDGLQKDLDQLPRLWKGNLARQIYGLSEGNITGSPCFDDDLALARISIV